MKIETADLTGAALNWVVKHLEELAWEAYDKALFAGKPTPARPSEWVRYEGHEGYEGAFEPSTDPAQGQPILEREKICTGYKHQADPDYCPINDEATQCWARTTAGGYLSYGPTMLIAGLRCFVASAKGDEVDVPDELVT